MALYQKHVVRSECSLQHHSYKTIRNLAAQIFSLQDLFITRTSIIRLLPKTLTNLVRQRQIVFPCKEHSLAIIVFLQYNIHQSCLIQSYLGQRSQLLILLASPFLNKGIPKAIRMPIVSHDSSLPEQTHSLTSCLSNKRTYRLQPMGLDHLLQINVIQ